MPDTIPTHFNSLGKPDNYGGKSSIFLLPILATAIYAAITWLNKHPHIMNYPMKITAENALEMYAGATLMLRFLKLAILIVFTMIIMFTYLVSVELIKNIGSWFLPLVLSIIFVPTIIFLIKSFKNTRHEKSNQGPV